MADQISSGERGIFSARPANAREISRRRRTRPMSKMMARSSGRGTDYLPSVPGSVAAAAGGPCFEWRLERRMLMMAGSKERTITTAMT